MYRVIWRRALIDLLTQIYTKVFEQGGDTEAITRAAARIDQLLANDPADQGESRDHYERVLIVGPLTVVFEVFEDERVALILKLVHHPRGS